MPPVYVDPAKVREFKTPQSFYDWLAANHDSETEVWIRIFRKATGLPTINQTEAIDAVLCWGWIDAIVKGLDEQSFVQRYTRRGPKSTWSQINRDNVGRLIEEGRMTPHGLKHVDAAKADGRWEKAYRVKGAEIPADLQAAIDADPKAKAMLAMLTAQNRFAMILRTESLKTEAGRKKRIAAYVEMLARGETIYPQKR